MTSPTPINQQSMNAPAPAGPPPAAAASAGQPETASADVTGSIPAEPAPLPDGHAFATVAIPPSEKLPDGIGVEQNLAESYKWFSLAAAQGDADSGRKRDDVAKRLDPQSLAAAKLAIQTFSPERQPDDAVKVASPAGGWDAAPAKPAAKASAARHGATKRAAR
jgi:hypothetical protein